MAKIDTDVYVNKEDIGKNLYRNKTYYTLCIEQDVLAKNQDEADNLFSDNGGIDHSKIGKDITDAKNGVETYMVDANYTDSGKTEFIGKVKYDDDTFTQTLEEAVENEDVYIDTYADEDEPLQLTKIKLVLPDTKVDYGDLKEPMTPEEEDKNAGIVRDKDGNVLPETTVPEKALNDYVKEKAESDIDIAINLENDSKLGK
jgi:hypothetical protein